MKFKFIGKLSLLLDTVTTNEVYDILQFEKKGKYLIVYLIDDLNNLLYIPYTNINDFNQQWKYIK